ncbi:MAG: DNA primase, partial [Opitutales bacterium]
FLTTTSIDIDEELRNRALILTVDESREQTERIHQLQRMARTPEGIAAAEKRKDVLRLLRNVQRLLKTRKITNPYAQYLTFTSERTRTRRDHEKYLTLIDTLALLHQYQRELVRQQVGEREIEMLPVTLDDIEAVNKLAPELLGRSLDELPPQTRSLLESIQEFVREKMEAEQTEQSVTLFSRRQLREFTGWSEFQVRTHLERLEQLEYVERRVGRQGSRCLYELLVDAHEAAKVWQVGLLDVEELRRKGL